MRRIASKTLFGAWALASVAASAFAHSEDCKDLLNSKGDPHIVLPSGREIGYLEEFKETADVLFRRGGVIEQLGIANPPQIHELVPSSELNVLAAIGRHAVPHWHDGAQIANAAKTAGGVLEFVTPGKITGPLCPVCRAFYSDTTEEAPQTSVLFHVAGHNDFAAHSMYASSRGADPIAEAMELSNLVARLYEEVDHDEVSRWYQWLLSLSQLQDLTNGTFTDPEEFDPKRADVAQSQRVNHATGPHEEGKNPYKNRKHPHRPTPSVLQALVKNFPATTARWKVEMAERFERMERVLGFYYNIKIQNEGWATLFQELLPPYTKHRTSHHSIEFAQLMQGVAFPSLSNPYYLGRECWRIVRRKFEARPEIKDLPPMEKDRQFLKYAHEEIISWMNDYQFIRFALDEQWVESNKLILQRKAEGDEINADLPPPRKPNQEQKIVVSRDPKRIIDWIARKLADRSRQLPDLWLHELSGFGRGVTDLRHHVVDRIPLKRETAAQALFVMAQITERPISLTTVWMSDWGLLHGPAAPNSPDNEEGEDKYDWMMTKAQVGPQFRSGIGPRRRGEAPKKPPLTVTDIRIEVEPSGKVRVFTFDGERDVLEQPAIAELYQRTIETYLADSETAINDDLSHRDLEYFRPMVAQSVDAHTMAATQMFSKAPTAGYALLEYANMLRKGTSRALKLAIQGVGRLRRTKTGIRVKVLPDIPTFQLDHGAAQRLNGTKPPSPVDSHLTRQGIYVTPAAQQNAGTSSHDADDTSVLGQGDLDTGDIFWGDKQDDGQGQGEGDPDDGDSEDGDDPSQGNGGEGKPTDPTEVEIPAELFIKALIEDFKLPNLRKQNPNGDPSEDDQFEGGVHRPNGRILWDRTIPAALNYAIQARRRKGLPTRGISQIVLYKEGLKYIQQADFVVSDRHPTPDPDKKAVVVFVIDLTGSMAGEPQRLAKEWVAYVDWLIRSFYKQVEIRFVGYSGTAQEFPREKIFNSFIGSITKDSTGFELSEKILGDKRYPDSQWDKYVFGIGDGGSDDTAKTQASLDRLYKKCSYMGWVLVKAVDMATESFVAPMRERAQKQPWFGYAEIDSGRSSVLQSILPFFKGKKK